MGAARYALGWRLAVAHLLAEETGLIVGVVNHHQPGLFMSGLQPILHQASYIGCGVVPTDEAAFPGDPFE